MTTSANIRGDRYVDIVVPAESSATADDTWTVWQPPHNVQVTGVSFVPDAAITANGTNYFTLELKKGATVLASRSWAATNSVANTAEAFTLNATVASRNASADDVITLVRTHVGGSGLASPRGVLRVKYRGR